MAPSPSSHGPDDPPRPRAWTHLAQRVGPVWRRVEPVWRRAEPFAAVGFFVAGFAWDALTLVRVDRLADNLLLGAYLLALGPLLVLEHRLATVPHAWPRLARHAPWVTYGAQFLFGSLFSAFVVLFAKSASTWSSMAYLVALTALMVLNEFLHDLLRTERLRVVLYWLAWCSFLEIAVPVTTGWPGPGLFVVAAVGAMGPAMAVAASMYVGLPGEALVDEATDAARRAHPRRAMLRSHALSLLGAAGLLGVLDLAGVIPPVPFALLEVGIFHDVEPRVEPDPTGTRRALRYHLTHEADPWPWPLGADDDRTFRWREGDAVHCFTAVFAPRGMELALFHRWQRHDPSDGTWVTTDRIPVTRSALLRGGAERGFRTYSRKRHVQPGAWRVIVELDDGRSLGHVDLDILADDRTTKRTWTTRTYD